MESQVVVITAVLTALQAHRPHPRYTVAVPVATKLVAALPDRAGDVLMRHTYHLGAPSTALQTGVPNPRLPTHLG
jgi:hypothetical protein